MSVGVMEDYKLRDFFVYYESMKLIKTRLTNEKFVSVKGECEI
jgi:hypothetical protein